MMRQPETSKGLQKEKKTDRLVFGSWRQQDYPREASGDHVSGTQTKIPPPPYAVHI